MINKLPNRTAFKEKYYRNIIVDDLILKQNYKNMVKQAMKCENKYTVNLDTKVRFGSRPFTSVGTTSLYYITTLKNISL